MSNKYGARKTVVDGITFDSQKEANRYGELKLLVRAGEIVDLEIHPMYHLSVDGIHITKYEGDFEYRDTRKGMARVVEDVKGVKTEVYKIKKNLMKAILGIEIKET